MPSYATEASTKRYADRLSATVAPGHFRRVQNLWMSSIGLGTYLGNYDAPTDLKYTNAIVQAVELGCNVIDTAINYRFQRSERSIGEALKQLASAGKAARDEIVVATKCGFLTFDSAPPANQADYFRNTYIKPGIIREDDIVAGCQCIAPRYIEDQIERSRRNLALECIDIYYLHNPEMQLDEVARPEFLRRMRAAFEVFEKGVAEGKIRMYGTATWDGYRTHPDAPNHLSLEELVRVARDIGGENHHFKVVQLPYNLAMPEAFTASTQRLGNRIVSMTEAAGELGINLMASASIMQSRLSYNLPPIIATALKGLDTDAQRAIQFVRSTPGIDVALVGMSRPEHVRENLKVATVPPAAEEDFVKLFAKG
jgi:aryl-alcohol dehydrogenase-like predicted oxidoreductase